MVNILLKMNILAWVVFGLIVGVIANLIEPGKAQGGLIGTTIIGILGGLLGGFLGSLIFGVGVTGFDVPSLIVAVIGSVLLIWILRAVRRV